MNTQMKRLFRGLGIVVCMLGCGNVFAQAGAVPLPPSFSEYVENNAGTINSIDPYDVTNGTSTAGTRYTSGEEGTASLTINSGDTDYQLAGATVSWEFIVIGPAIPNFTMPVFLRGMGDVSVTTQPYGDTTTDDARVDLNSTAFGALGAADQSRNGQQFFGISLGATVDVNTPYFITETISGY